jgi:hypothetical protein
MAAFVGAQIGGNTRLSVNAFQAVMAEWGSGRDLDIRLPTSWALARARNLMAILS